MGIQCQVQEHTQPLSTLYQHTLSTHPINTFDYRSLKEPYQVPLITPLSSLLQRLSLATGEHTASRRHQRTCKTTSYARFPLAPAPGLGLGLGFG